MVAGGGEPVIPCILDQPYLREMLADDVGCVVIAGIIDYDDGSHRRMMVNTFQRGADDMGAVICYDNRSYFH